MIRMHTVSIASAVVVAASVAVAAQATRPAPPTSKSMQTMQSTSRAAAEKALMANEEKINEVVAKGDVAAFKTMVADTATSLDGMSGFMSIAQFEQALPSFKVTGVKLSEMRVIWIDDSSAIVAYKWSGKGTFQGQLVPSPTYASTTWTKQGGKWLAVFHQESMVPPGGAK